MEAQPIAIVQQFLVPYLLLSNVLLDTMSIVLLLAGLQWWAMLIMYLSKSQPRNNTWTKNYTLLGIVIALVCVGVTHSAQLTSASFVIIVLAVTLWSWKRGSDYARTGLNDEYLVRTFKIGFAALLVVICFALFGDTTLEATLTSGLPIFFLSGMLALSFTRIAIIQKEHARQPGSSRKEATGKWVAALTTAWVVVVAGSIALDALPLQIIMQALSPLAFLLDLLARGLLYILSGLSLIVLMIIGTISVLVNWIFPQQAHQVTPPAENMHLLNTVTQSKPGLAYEIVVGVALLIAIIMIIIVIKKKIDTRHEDTSSEEEEEREKLNIGEVWRSRHKERKPVTQEEVQLAALDPASTRARYRAFLQSMADMDADLERQANETPVEYQQRIQTFIHTSPASESMQPADPAMLDTLTQAYVRERYGGKRPGQEQQSYLSTWIPVLVQHLSSMFATRTRTKTPAQASTHPISEAVPTANRSTDSSASAIASRRPIRGSDWSE